MLLTFSFETLILLRCDLCWMCYLDTSQSFRPRKQNPRLHFQETYAHIHVTQAAIFVLKIGKQNHLPLLFYVLQLTSVRYGANFRIAWMSRSSTSSWNLVGTVLCLSLLENFPAFLLLFLESWCLSLFDNWLFLSLFNRLKHRTHTNKLRMSKFSLVQQRLLSPSSKRK